MKPYSLPMKLTFCLIVLPGYFVYSQQANWTFTLPESIEASVNSTVVIPCTFSAPEEPGHYLVIWYMIDIYGGNNHSQVFNSEDPSEVSEEYRNRSALIGDGNNCTLRIKDVRYTAWYFLEISNNSFNLSNVEKPVKINVRGCLYRSSCSEWSFNFPRVINALNNSCVVIPCTLTHPDKALDSNLLWLERSPTRDIEVYNNKTLSNIDAMYTNRTSLFRIKRSSCAMTIQNVQKDGQYYPGINRIINAYNLDGKFVTVTVSDVPPKPVIKGAANLKASVAANITCSVAHSCPSILPLLEWNVPMNTTMTHVNLTRGTWELQSKLRYVPSFKDNNRSLKCTATFPNGQKSVQKVTLSIVAQSKRFVVVIVAVVGLGFLLLLLLLLFIYRRKKISHTSESNEMGESPELTYARLDRRTVSEDYDTLKVDYRGKSTRGIEYEAPDYENIQRT
ncbi:sialic acid-binding Ig-like lectin 12 [Hyla sarda]|uniref:sialic acid-binding Ig-like lectin 12 n=1 Tax=Hyla sarda TaxID=327740 RepID=UPI0024C352C7|nr:sialic acid-binding Ig-like lectin 12 [Hyla sarda]